MMLMQRKIRPDCPSPDLNLHEAIATIYRSTGDASAWREVASLLARVFDADAVVLCHTEGDAVRLLGEGLYNLSPEDAAKLPVRYSRAALPPAAHHSGAGMVRTVDDAGFARDIDRLPGGARVLTVVIPEIDHTEPQQAAHLSVANTGGRLPFSANQQDLRVLLSQHLTEAVRIQRRFSRLQRKANFHSMAILHLGEAWLVVDRELELVDCNPLARGFLMRSELMRLRDGHVVFPDADTLQRVEEAMALAWAATGDLVQINLVKPGDGAQVSLEFKPAYLSDDSHGEAPDGLMILVREVDRQLMLKIEAKAESCKLSRAERRVMVHLVRSGQPPAAIAMAIGTSERTIRCQLSSIFRKTGARNQQELIRMTLMM
ncbi:MAG: helix-turn-helix transcriptional regulator [Rhodocyclaceae bacterium]|nr:helix-turn-helix transcriptional regulator [Rhodocyclaceae bacterium]